MGNRVQLQRSLTAALAWYTANAGDLPDALAARYDALKNEGGYARSVRRAVRDLYNGVLSLEDFQFDMYGYIDRQLTAAFREGLREVGAKMTAELESLLESIIQNERNYVANFALEIRDAKAGERSIDPFLVRADLWANRYNEVKNEAILAATTAEAAETGETIKLVWIYGDDKEHCETCANLHNAVARVEVWDESGLRPQSPPNDALACGGWRCGCRLETTERRVNCKTVDDLLERAGV